VKSYDAFNQRLNSKLLVMSCWGTATYSFIIRPFTGSNLAEFGYLIRNSLALTSPNLRKTVSPKTPVNIFQSIKKAGFPNIIRLTEFRSLVRMSSRAVFSRDGLGQGITISVSKVYESIKSVLKYVIGVRVIRKRSC
jgi:hypothetical protein